MSIADCMRRRRVNVNLRRLFLYITIIALISSFFVNFIFRSLATPSHHLRQQQEEAPAADGAENIDGQLRSSVSEAVSSSTSTSLPCDDECLRFGRLLDSWPADKPKAAIVLLLRPSSVDTFARSSRLFSANFNDAYGYPVIVFHEENMNNMADRQRLRSLTNSSLYFQVRCVSSLSE